MMIGPCTCNKQALQNIAQLTNRHLMHNMSKHQNRPFTRTVHCFKHYTSQHFVIKNISWIAAKMGSKMFANKVSCTRLCSIDITGLLPRVAGAKASETSKRKSFCSFSNCLPCYYDIILVQCHNIPAHDKIFVNVLHLQTLLIAKMFGLSAFDRQMDSHAS